MAGYTKHFISLLSTQDTAKNMHVNEQIKAQETAKKKKQAITYLHLIKHKITPLLLGEVYRLSMNGNKRVAE